MIRSLIAQVFCRSSRLANRRNRWSRQLVHRAELLEPRSMFAANLAPVNAVPGAQTATVDQPLAFTAYRGNLISISDPDAGTANVQVTLSVDRGTLDLINRNPGNRLTYTTGDGTADATMTFAGTLADINTALAWVSYQPQAERFFQWQSSAGGNDHWYEYVSTGTTWTAANTAATTAGGYLATLTSAGESTFVNAFLPSNAEAWVGGYQDRTGFTFSEPLGGWRWVTSEPWSYTNWNTSEPNDAGGTEHYLTTNSGGSFKWNDRANTLSTPYVIEYDFDPRPANYRNATLTIVTNDLGNVGTGGALSDTDTVAIMVNPVAAFAASPTVPTLPATLDTSFNGTGRQVLSITSDIDYIHDMKVLPSGKILAVGAINNRFGLMRFNADMTLDATFGSGGGTQSDFGAGTHARSLTIDSSGRIIVVGGDRIARYTADGVLDATFGTNGWMVEDHVAQCWSADIEADGAILVVGGDSTEFRIARYTAAGVRVSTWTFDSDSYNNGNTQFVKDAGRVIYSLGDGDFVIAGRGYRYAYEKFLSVMRVAADGTREANLRYDFAADSTATEMAHSGLRLPDGKMLLIGESEGQCVVSRHLASGALDSSFGSNGYFKSAALSGSAAAYRATLAADGKIIVTGFANNGVDQDIFVVRMSYDGVPDTSFGAGGKTSVNLGSNDYGYAVATTADGKIVIAGRSGNDIALIRLLGDSNQSATAVNQTPVNSSPVSQTVTVDQPFAFTAYRGNRISISDADAGDNQLQVSLTVNRGTITLINSDPSGGLTYSVGDGFQDATMTFTGTLADINTALAWVSYQPQAAYTGAATLTIVTNDLGNAGTGGALSDTDTVAITVNPVAAFAASPTVPTLPATLDTSFNGTGRQVLSITSDIDYIHDMKVLPSGKILAVGAINNRFGLMRFNADMTLDATFGSGGGTQSDFGAGTHARSLTIDSSGRIIVVGGDRIARYTADGVLDATFGTNGWMVEDHVAQCWSADIEADGAILVVGGDSTEFRIARYTAAGVRVSTWTFDSDSYNNGNTQFVKDAGRVIYSLGDGDFVIAGRGYRYAYEKFLSVMRVAADGTREANLRYDFAADSTATEMAHSGLRLPDGKMLLIGESEGQCVVSRHLASGALDSSFGSNGYFKSAALSGSAAAYRATLAADGKIIVTGFANNGVDQDIFVVRMSYDGVPDTSFGAGGKTSVNLGSNDYGYAVATTADGKIVIAGRSGNDIALVRLMGDYMPNAAPTDIALSALTISENLPVGTTVGTLTTTDPNAGDTFIYTLISGDGAADNAAFVIDGGSLKTATVFDYEARNSYSIHVRSADALGLATEKTIVVTVANVNESPGEITLSGTSLAENQPAGTVIGTLTTTDPDASETITYALVPGAGDSDNAAFQIVGNELRTSGPLNYEFKSTYTIRVRATDQGGLSRETSFTVTVTNLAEPLGIAAVIPPAFGTYRAGAVLRFTVVTTEPVTVRGRPTVNLRIGTATRAAGLESAAGNQMVFAYRVTAADHDLDGVVVGTVINRLPRGAFIRDGLGRNLPLALPTVNAAGVRIDNKGPVSIGSVAVPQTGIYRAGETLEFRVSFNEIVQVGGVPQIQFTFMTGTRRQVRQAQYVEGSGSTLLIFRYTVRVGDIAPRGITLATSINMNVGGFIRDVVGNSASLAVRVPVGSGIRLDATTAPSSLVTAAARDAAFAQFWR